MVKGWDVIVIGAGATGGWAAKNLSERGMRVALLDAGPYIDTKEDFQKGILRTLERGAVSTGNLARVDDSLAQLVNERQHIQQRSYAYNRHTSHFFVDDIDNPYEVPDGKPFTWIRSRQVGGRSNLWARVAVRMSDHQFKGGINGLPSWPLSYSDLTRHYEVVEKYTRVTGTTVNHPEVPDGIFSDGGVPVQDGELLLQKTAEALWPGAPRLFRLREVSLTQPSVSVISREAVPFFSSVGSTIPAAECSGLFKVVPNAVVHTITTESSGRRANGVQYFDADTGEAKEIGAKVVMLCASALESTRILLNSRSSAHPNGLGNSSNVLGHYLMDHVCGAWVKGLKRKQSTRGLLVGVYMPPLRNNFGCAFGAQGLVNNCAARFASFGEMFPRFENHVALSSNLKDRWGIPALRIDCQYSDEERAGAYLWHNDMEKLLRSAGYDTERSGDTLDEPGSGVHEMGTARMGKDPRSSVLNSYCRSWDVDNLFVTDGAAFVTSSFHNPTLTMMALTDRACSFISERYNSEYA